MDRLQGYPDHAASTLAMFRRAIVVGCAAILIAWQFLPRSSSCRVVTISSPAWSVSRSGEAAIAGEAAVRRWIIPADSPQLKHLEDVAAEMQRRSARRLPPEYYAEQWRIAAAQYYYERELQRERLATAESDANPLAPTSTAAIAPVSFHSSGEEPNSAAVGSRYWQREGREAQARQRALLASLPARGTVQRPTPTITFGAEIRGRPTSAWTAAATIMALLVGVGMWWLQQTVYRTAVATDVRPLMQLVVPREWVRQSPTRGQRLVNAIGFASWLAVLGCFAAILR